MSIPCRAILFSKIGQIRLNTKDAADKPSLPDFLDG